MLLLNGMIDSSGGNDASNSMPSSNCIHNKLHCSTQLHAVMLKHFVDDNDKKNCERNNLQPEKFETKSL